MLMLDMDGVIVDFVRGCFKKFDRTDIRYEDISWDLEKIFFPDAPPKHFWNQLGYEFWATLPWTPGGEYLLKQLVNIAGQDSIVICTSPCATRGCAEGKIEWINQNIPWLKRQFMITPVKHFAARGNILIDDHKPNIEKWQQHGGRGFLYPQPWNDSNRTMESIIEQMRTVVPQTSSN